jgi:hypothetical protein
VTADGRADRPARLDPVPSRWDWPSWRRGYEGAYFEAVDGRLTYVGPTADPERGWSFPIGSRPGEAAGIIHVIGNPFVGGWSAAGWQINRFAVVDATGEMLTSIPAGWSDGKASSYYGDTPGGFRPHDAKTFAEQAGLTYSLVRIDVMSQVVKRFPGLVWGARYYEFMSYLVSAMFVLGGVMFLGIPFASSRPAASSLGGLLHTSVIFGAGLLFLAAGLVVWPPMTVRVAARARRLHPERFASEPTE